MRNQLHDVMGEDSLNMRHPVQKSAAWILQNKAVVPKVTLINGRSHLCLVDLSAELT